MTGSIHDNYITKHNYLDHDYIIMICYLDININGLVYNNSSATTAVKTICGVASVHAIPVVNVGGNRGETRNAPEGDTTIALDADPSDTQLMMAWRRRRQNHKTSNSIAIVRFTPTTIEGEYYKYIVFNIRVGVRDRICLNHV